MHVRPKSNLNDFSEQKLKISNIFLEIDCIMIALEITFNETKNLTINVIASHF